jgi:hypothetical protein
MRSAESVRLWVRSAYTSDRYFPASSDGHAAAFDACLLASFSLCDTLLRLCGNRGNQSLSGSR